MKRSEKEIFLHIEPKPYLKIYEKGTQAIGTYEMLPHDYVNFTRKMIKDFYLSKDINKLIIYTMSDMVVRELSNMVIAYFVRRKKLSDFFLKEYESEKYVNKVDTKYYTINPKKLHVTGYDIRRLNFGSAITYKVNFRGIKCDIMDHGIDEQNSLQGSLFELQCMYPNNKKTKNIKT